MQDPDPEAATSAVQSFLTTLQDLGWVDQTALGLMAVFFVIGLFKGFWWQVTRIGILAAGYALAAHFGQLLSEQLLRLTHQGPRPTTADEQETAFYIACVLIFVAVLVALSLTALLVQRLVARSDMTFLERVGGALAGVATGAAVVLLLQTAMLMFFRHSEVAAAASESRSLRLSRQAIALLGGALPDEIHQVFAEPADPEPRQLDPAQQPAPVDAPVTLPDSAPEPVTPQPAAPTAGPPRQPNRPGAPRNG